TILYANDRSCWLRPISRRLIRSAKEILPCKEWIVLKYRELHDISSVRFSPSTSNGKQIVSLRPSINMHPENSAVWEAVYCPLQPRYKTGVKPIRCDGRYRNG